MRPRQGDAAPSPRRRLCPPSPGPKVPLWRRRRGLAPAPPRRPPSPRPAASQPAASPQRGSIFSSLFGGSPTARLILRAAAERSWSGASLGAFGSAQVLGVRRRRALRRQGKKGSSRAVSRAIASLVRPPLQRAPRARRPRPPPHPAVEYEVPVSFQSSTYSVECRSGLVYSARIPCSLI